MPTETCDTWADRLVDCADGELAEPERAAVGAHLAKCVNCRRRVEALGRSLSAAMGVWSAAVDELEPIAVPAERRAGRGRKPLRRLALAAAAAAVLAVLVWPSTPVPPVAGREAGATSPSVAQVEQEIWEAGIASQMLLVADMLAETPGGRPYAVERLRFISSHFSDTQLAGEARERLAALTEGAKL